MPQILVHPTGVGPSADLPFRGISPLLAETLRDHRPAAHLVLVRGDSAVSRCSIWTEGTPSYEAHRVGLIGHYAANDAESGIEILNAALARLGDSGCTLAIGPMDGNTWRPYRLLTWRGGEPGFFLEPDNPDEWPAYFDGAGFEPMACYTSALNTDLSSADPRVPKAIHRFANEGLVIRPIDLHRFDEELQGVHRLSLTAFADNLLYTPISQEQFFAQYRPLQPHLQRELILIAEDTDGIAGFIFAIPDLNQARRGAAIDTAIIKTLAVHPGRRCAGLGSVLMDQCHLAAHRLGYRRAIHALMHESNASRRISMRSAQTIRRYTLYAKSLSS